MLAFNAGSFAPFAFSPIAFAIQELIEDLQEARSQVYGSGRLARASSQPGFSARREDEALTREVVEAQWDLLELRRANQAADAALARAAGKPAPAQFVAQPASEVATPSAGVNESLTVAAAVEQAQLEAAARELAAENEAALLVLLALA